MNTKNTKNKIKSNQINETIRKKSTDRYIVAFTVLVGLTTVFRYFTDAFPYEPLKKIIAVLLVLLTAYYLIVIVNAHNRDVEKGRKQIRRK